MSFCLSPSQPFSHFTINKLRTSREEEQKFWLHFHLEWREKGYGALMLLWWIQWLRDVCVCGCVSWIQWLWGYPQVVCLQWLRGDSKVAVFSKGCVSWIQWLWGYPQIVCRWYNSCGVIQTFVDPMVVRGVPKVDPMVKAWSKGFVTWMYTQRLGDDPPQPYATLSLWFHININYLQPFPRDSTTILTTCNPFLVISPKHLLPATLPSWFHPNINYLQPFPRDFTQY